MQFTKIGLLALALAACGDDSGNGPSDAAVVVIPDAPEFAPVITGLAASPASGLSPNVPTAVTFNWAYLVEPTYPEPTCTIDNGVGTVMRGVPVMITISTLTLFTMTCSNRAGQGMRQVIVNVTPSAPQIATFTVTPSSVTPGTATPLTFTWTYSNTPSPVPTCSIDNGQTTITSGTPTTLTLTQARTFRLRCTNGVGGPVYSGGAIADVTVAANECGTAYAQCDAHAACTDTTNGYTCACGNGYNGDGDTCSLTTTVSTDCDSNAQFLGTSCVCKAGYFGSGAVGDCKRGRFTFVTSVTGSGLLSSWLGAGTNNGLAAADAICQARAAAHTSTAYPSGLPGTYVAWISDSTHDAYCRAQTDGATGHLNGKKAGNCGLGQLPIAAGPWVRVGDWKQWSPAIDKLLTPNSITYFPANRDENGNEITSTTDRVWTGTDNSGQYVAGATCNDWLSSSSSFAGVAGEVHGGGSSWTQTSATNPFCNNTTGFHLRCVEVSATTPAALPPRHPTLVKKAFITSVQGNGLLSSWPDSYGQTGSNAPDAICQARARYAGFANAAAFKAWLAYPSYISNKFTSTTFTYVRPDGVPLGTSRNDMLDSKLSAAWNQTELGTYLTGNGDTGSVTTNIYGASGTTGQYYGSSSAVCSNWSSNASFYNWYIGRYDLLDSRAYNLQTTSTCDQTNIRFYCVED